MMIFPVGEINEVLERFGAKDDGINVVLWICLKECCIVDIYGR